MWAGKARFHSIEACRHLLGPGSSWPDGWNSTRSTLRDRSLAHARRHRHGLRHGALFDPPHVATTAVRWFLRSGFPRRSSSQWPFWGSWRRSPRWFRVILRWPEASRWAPVWRWSIWPFSGATSWPSWPGRKAGGLPPEIRSSSRPACQDVCSWPVAFFSGWPGNNPGSTSGRPSEPFLRTEYSWRPTRSRRS